MTTSYSYSDSYTIVDVRKVMDQVHADLRMIAQSTGLWTQSHADRIMADIMRFAEEGYLDHVRIRLVGSNGKNVRVYGYDVHKNVAGWTGGHAGGNLWAGLAHRMTTTVTYSEEWDALTATQKADFKATLSIGWSPTTDDLSVSHLTVSDQWTYASNGYGIKKTVYG